MPKADAPGRILNQVLGLMRSKPIVERAVFYAPRSTLYVVQSQFESELLFITRRFGASYYWGSKELKINKAEQYCSALKIVYFKSHFI